LFFGLGVGTGLLAPLCRDWAGSFTLVWGLGWRLGPYTKVKLPAQSLDHCASPAPTPIYTYKTTLWVIRRFLGRGETVLQNNKERQNKTTQTKERKK